MGNDSEGFVNVVIPPLPQSFTYRSRGEQSGGGTRPLEVGFRVEVPFGRRRAIGFVTACENITVDPEISVRDIPESDNNQRCFNSEQLKFFEQISSYYAEPLATVIDSAVPLPSPRRYETWVSLVPGAPPPRGDRQRALVELITSSAHQPVPLTSLSRAIPRATTLVQALARKGFLQLEKRELIDEVALTQPVPTWAKREVTLNESQVAIAADIRGAIDDGVFTPFLLHGVTGSGKTEVYIDAIQHALARGRSALIIVPEIALTPQLIDRFQARLGGEIGVLHSGVGRRSRWGAWRALLEGRCRIALGARSAVFAPTSSLGVIVVDEEHDGSYKQNDGVRYNARDVALLRGKLASCPVILGSATPSLESFHHAAQRRYRYLPLRTRHQDVSLPTVTVVDLNRVKPWEMMSAHVSPTLHQQLTETLARGNQSFILYNRRGFASYLQCDTCEHVIECPHCSVTLTYHQSTNSLLCHYCGLARTPETMCPQCAKPGSSENRPPHGGTLVHRGAGTERIYDELRDLFPQSTIERLDRDSATDLDAYRSILERARRGETHVIVGTQMIAKGHDLPGVTLVGVADCDVGLHMPDFRAGERIFQLLTQAAGRAGRGEHAGRVVLQTRVPRHPSIIYTASASYQSFAECELAARRRLNYPPFVRMARVLASSPIRELAQRSLDQARQRILSRIAAHSLSVSILGPAPAPIARLKSAWRYHLILKSTSASALNLLMRDLRNILTGSKQLRIIFDIDPQEML